MVGHIQLPAGRAAAPTVAVHGSEIQLFKRVFGIAKDAIQGFDVFEKCVIHSGLLCILC